MATHGRLHPSSWVLFALVVGILGCGGGGDGGESFLVSGLWSVNGTPGAGTPNPSDSSLGGRACSAAAASAGALPATQINVVQVGSTARGSEVGSDLTFTGTVNDPAQSFTLTSTTPICSQQGSCQVCGAIAGRLPQRGGQQRRRQHLHCGHGKRCVSVQCTITFPPTSATRS